MNKLIKNISAIALAAGIVALPGAANALTLTTTSTASLTVTDKCSITGANVDLGTYSVNQKWSEVGAVLGVQNSPTTYVVGSKGVEYIKWGTVTCENNLPYTLAIDGNGAGGLMKFIVNNKTASFAMFVKKIGATVVSDTNAVVLGAGGQAEVAPVAGKGTGAAQDVLGSVVLAVGAGSIALADPLTTAGTYTDTLNYTLTF